MTDGTWIWGVRVPGADYVELRAPSYRQALADLCAKYGGELEDDGSRWRIKARYPRVRIVGYRAHRPPRQASKPKVLPEDPLHVPARQRKPLGAVAMRIYVALRADFPCPSILTDRQQLAYSHASLVEFLANFGLILEHLPREQREAIQRRVDLVVGSWQYAAEETNARRSHRQRDAEFWRMKKKNLQESADLVRRRKAYREGVKAINQALDGLLPRSERAVHGWLEAMIAAGQSVHDAVDTGTRLRAVGIPRM